MPTRSPKGADSCAINVTPTLKRANTSFTWVTLSILGITIVMNAGKFSLV